MYPSQDRSSFLENSSFVNSQNSDEMLQGLLVDDEREDFAPKPQEKKPLNYFDITVAFLLAAGEPLPYGVTASFFLGVVIELGTFLFDLKPVSDTTYDEMYEWASEPYNSTNYPDTGLGKNTRDAVNFAATTAENLVTKEMFGTPTTFTNSAMIAILSLTGLLIISRVIWLITLHLQKKINLKYPMFEKDKIEQIASEYDAEHPRGDNPLEEYVANTYVLQTEERQQSSGIEHVEPIMYALILPMYIVLTQNIAKALNGQNEFNDGVDTEVAYQADQASTSHCGTDYPLPSNQTSSDLEMDCNYWGYVNGGAKGQRTEMESYGPLEQTLSWGLTFLALVSVVAIAWRSKPIRGRQRSPVYGQLAAAANGQVWFLLLASSAFELLPQGYMTYPGKALYDGIKAQAFEYAGKSLTAGGLGMIDPQGEPTEAAYTYAASVAQYYVAAFLKGNAYAVETVKEFYEGNFDGSPTTWGNGVAAGLLALGAVYFAARLAYIHWFVSRSIINIDSPYTEKEQHEWLANVGNHDKIDFAKKHKHPLFIFDTYPNLVLGAGAQDKKNEISYQIYKWLHNFTQNQPYPRVPSLATIGTVMAIGLVLIIASAQILSLKISKQLVNLFDKYFDITHNLMVSNQNCITDDQKTNCNGVAANDGLVYGTEDYMGSIDSAENSTYYWLPLAVTVGIPVVALLLIAAVFGIEKTMRFVSTEPTSNQSNVDPTVVPGSFDAQRSDADVSPARPRSDADVSPLPRSDADISPLQRSDASDNLTDQSSILGGNARKSSDDSTAARILGGIFSSTTSPRLRSDSQELLITNDSDSLSIGTRSF